MLEVIKNNEIKTFLNENKVKTKPSSLIKWSGSKRQIAYEIFLNAPTNVNNYYEPFLGGGSVLFYFSSVSKKSFASDLYGTLVDFWENVKDKPKKVVKHYSKNWHELQEDLPGHFYNVRERFNKKSSGLDLAFLSRTCVNGIIRFNNAGEFNNSFHLSRKGMKPEMFEKIVMEWSEKVQNTTFSQKSYDEILSDVKKGDLVYLDPPYLGSKQRYIESLDEDKLLVFLDKLNSKNVNFALSFDGSRGEKEYFHEIPRNLYRRKLDLNFGHSAVSKVLNGKSEKVTESLYLNY